MSDLVSCPSDCPAPCCDVARILELFAGRGEPAFPYPAKRSGLCAMRGDHGCMDYDNRPWQCRTSEVRKRLAPGMSEAEFEARCRESCEELRKGR